MDNTYTEAQIEAALLEEAAKMSSAVSATPPRPPTVLEDDKPTKKSTPKAIPMNKIVFLQVEEQYKGALLEILSSDLAFNEAGFRFVLLPLDTKILDREELREILRIAVDNV